MPLRWLELPARAFTNYNPLCWYFMSWCEELRLLFFVTQTTRFWLLAIVLFSLKVFLLDNLERVFNFFQLLEVNTKK
jgi:hypothetical protein